MFGVEAPPYGGNLASGSEVISMRFEMTRTFPVPLQQGWDYVEDFHTWHEWQNLEVVDPEECAREKPGDTVRVAGKMIGQRFPGSLILEEMVSPERSRTLYRWPGWPDIHVEQHYAEAGPGAFTVRLVAYVDDEAGMLGKAAAWVMTNLPFMMQREVRGDFDRLDVVFRKGVAEKKEEAKKPSAKARTANKQVA